MIIINKENCKKIRNLLHLDELKFTDDQIIEFFRKKLVISINPYYLGSISVLIIAK